MPTFETMPKGMTFSFVSSSTVRLVELPLPELLSQFFPRAVDAVPAAPRSGLSNPGEVLTRRQQQIEKPFLGQACGLFLHLLGHLVLNHVDADLGKVADDRLDVASHVSDLGEL